MPRANLWVEYLQADGLLVFVKPFCFHGRRGGCVEGTGSWSPFGVQIRESGVGMRWAWRQGLPHSAPAGFLCAAGLQPGCSWSTELLPSEAVLSAACCVLITLMLCLTEQLLKWPKGPGKRKHPPSPVRMRALVVGYSGATWYYFIGLFLYPSTK